MILKVYMYVRTLFIYMGKTQSNRTLDTKPDRLTSVISKTAGTAHLSIFIKLVSQSATCRLLQLVPVLHQRNPQICIIFQVSMDSAPQYAIQPTAYIINTLTIQIRERQLAKG